MSGLLVSTPRAWRLPQHSGSRSRNRVDILREEVGSNQARYGGTSDAHTHEVV